MFTAMDIQHLDNDILEFSATICESGYINCQESPSREWQMDGLMGFDR